MTAPDLDDLCRRLRDKLSWDTPPFLLSGDELDALLDALEAMTAERNSARTERDRYRDTLLARHGGEPVALLKELDAARADLREALALIREGYMGIGLDSAYSDWVRRCNALLARHKEQA